MDKIYLKWEDININWEDLHMNWEDIFLILEAQNVSGGSSGISDYIKGNPWDKFKRDLGEEKTDKLIKIVCKVNGLKYEQVKKKNSMIKIEVSHFEKTFKSVPNLKIKV